MKLTLEVEVSDEVIEELATKIAGKIGAAPKEDEDDDFGGTKEEEKLTLADVQDVVGKAVTKYGKDKIKALVKKVSGADKVSAIPEDKFQAVIDAIGKLK